MWPSIRSTCAAWWLPRRKLGWLLPLTRLRRMAAFVLFPRLIVPEAWPSSFRSIAAEGPVEAGPEEEVTLEVVRPPAVLVAATLQRLAPREERRLEGALLPGATRKTGTPTAPTHPSRIRAPSRG